MTDKPSDDDAVVIRQFADVRQADFALSVLQGHEIEGFLDVPFTSSMFPHYALVARRGRCSCAPRTPSKRWRFSSRVPTATTKPRI